MTTNNLGYAALRETVGIYENTSDVYKLTGADISSLLTYVAAQSTEYTSPGAVLDSLVLKEDGSVDGLITVIWDEDFVIVLADKAMGFDAIAAETIASQELTDVKVENISDTFRLVYVEGPESWRVVTKFYQDDVAQIVFSTFVPIDEPVAGGTGIVARYGSTGEFGYFIAVDSPTEDLLAQMTEVVVELGGAVVPPAALRRAQMEMHHPILPEQAAGATVREASLTWLVGAMREDEFRGKAHWNTAETMTRGLISVMCPVGTMPAVGTPVSAGDTEIGKITLVADTCGAPKDLGRVLVETPFNVPGMTFTAGGVTLESVASPTVEPKSWTSIIGDLA